MLSHILSPVTSTADDMSAPDVITARALVALGETADTVAAALTAAGFTGFPVKADQCPIGRYIRACDARITDVSVATDVVRVYTGSGTTPGVPVSVPLPNPVRTFLGRFDARRYPDLIAGTGESASTVGPEPGMLEAAERTTYPVPTPAHDARFTFGLILNVGQVLAEHGYPPIKTGADFVRLQQALFGFIYALAPTGPQASPPLKALADPGTPAHGDDVGRVC